MQYKFCSTMEILVILGNTEHSLRVIGNGPSYSIEQNVVVSEQCLCMYPWKDLREVVPAG